MDIIGDYNHYLSDHENKKSLQYMQKYLFSRINNKCNKIHKNDYISNARKY